MHVLKLLGEDNFHLNCPSKEELEVPIWTFQEMLP